MGPTTTYLGVALLLLAAAGRAKARQPRQLAQGVPDAEPLALLAGTPTTEKLLRLGPRLTVPGASDADSGLPWLRAADTFSGDGTAFSDPVNNTGAAFACSFRYINDQFSQHFAAINQAQWENGATCGRCIKARCVDPRCKVQNEDLLVQVVDLCPECKHGDVDFSYPAYTAITGMWPHRLKITWEWASCAPEINGTISFTPKDGSTQFWQAFFLANMRFPIKSAKLNGLELSRSPYQFFIHPGMIPGPDAVLELTADNGATVTATIADVTKAQDLNIQFPL